MGKVIYNMKNAAHQALSTVKRSSTHVFSSWLSDKKVERELSVLGLDWTKSAILSELSGLVGHGLSERKFKEYERAFGKITTSRSFMLFLGNAMLNGENLSVSLPGR